MKEAIDGLASLKIEWNLLKDKIPENISFLNLRVLHGAPTFYKDGTLNFAFHKVMLDLVSSPAIYGTIDIDLQAQFESKFSHALYENSTRFVNLNKNKVVDLETFRRLLGVEDGKTTSMRELNRNVIVRSLEEVNDLADFTVKLDAIKTGKKVTAFEVSVNPKNKPATNESFILSKTDQQVQSEILATVGSVNDKILEGIFKKHSNDYILEKLNYTKKHAKKEKTGYFPIPYFISALNNDYKQREPAAQKNQVGVEKPIKSPHEIWNDKMHALQADLVHWKGMLAKIDSNDTSKSEQINKIVLQCEGLINTHNLSKPTEEAI